MKSLRQLFSRLSEHWWWFALALAIPAFTINLGSVAFIDDEGIRSQVALEMWYTGDYLVPKMFGEYYYKKPPLFNWLIASYYQLTGDLSETASRSVTLIFLALYTWAIFYFFRKIWGHKLGLWTAFATLSCGRILFWDSMLGLIDICFSLVVFLSFMYMYRHRSGSWRKFYLKSYGLMTVGFMLKALPALAFQGLSVLAALADLRRWRPLFHPWHFAALGASAVALGAYYLAYAQSGDLATLFRVMFFESSQRTPVHFGVWDTLWHLVEFPFEMSYHFLPWSLLPLLLISKSNRHRLLGDPFARYLGILFAFNIVLYWVSPQVYPRYLLMLAPLYFGIGLFLYERHERAGDSIARAVRHVVLSLVAVAMMGGITAGVGLEALSAVPYLFVKMALILVLLGLCFYLLYSRLIASVPALILTLLVLRLGFSFFVLPLREASNYGTVIRADAQRIGEKFKDQSLVLYDSTYLNASTGYYLTKSYGRVIPVDTGQLQAGVYYIIDSSFFPALNYRVVDSMRIRQDRKTMVIGVAASAR